MGKWKDKGDCPGPTWGPMGSNSRSSGLYSRYHSRYHSSIPPEKNKQTAKHSDSANLCRGAM